MGNYSRQNVSELVQTNSFREIVNKFVTLTLVLFTAFVFISTLNGCSGGGGSSSTQSGSGDTGGGSTGGDTGGGSTGGDTGGSTGYTGSASISGTVDLSQLSSQDSNTISSKSASGKSAFNKSSRAVSLDPTTEAIKLYVVNSTGELEDTGITCSMTEDNDGNRNFECDGVKDGVNYIVRYVKIAGSGKALEMKANVFVPEGETAPTTPPEVTPESSIVVKALVDAVVSATTGTEISDEVVNKIIDSVKTAIVTLVDSGAIQIPSMVVDVEEDADLDSVMGTDTKNENADNVVGQVLADENIDTELGTIASENTAKLFDVSQVSTDEEKEAMIHKVFKELLKDDKGGSDDMPDLFYKFFTWLYVNDMTKTAQEMLSEVLTGMDFSDAVTNKDYFSTDTAVTDALAMFNSKLEEIYTIMAKTEPSLDEKKAIAEIPPVLLGLFPSDSLPLTASTSLNTPQAIAIVIFTDDVFVDSKVTTNLTGTLNGTADDSGQIEYQDEDLYEINEDSLFTFLGIEQYAAANPSAMQGIDIFHLELNPGTVWINNDNGGTEKDSLSAYTDVMDMSLMMSDGDPNLNGDSGAVITLTYPKASGGTGTASFTFIQWKDGNGGWAIDPWAQAEMNSNDQQQDVQIDESTVISDFTSGTYTVKVVYNGTTTEKSFEKTVITGMSDKYVKIITPKGMPHWPGNNATQAEMDAFNNAQDTFNRDGGRTNFTANVDDSGNEATGDSATKAKITLKWEAPEVTLPEGVIMVYDLDIGRGGCDENGCNWEPIWNTWEHNKQIYTTSFTIPHLFDIQSTEDAQNSPYHLNINVSFVKKSTGERLGSGGNAHTEFTVGEPLDITKTFKLNGQNTITINDDNIDASKLKITLVRETREKVGDQETNTQTVVKSSSIIGTTGYALTLTISDFLGENIPANAWYNLVIAEDTNDEIVDGSAMPMVPTYWPDYSTGGMWFDTYGGTLKVGKDTCTSDGNCFHEETVITGDEIVDGPKFNLGGYMEPPKPDNVDPVPGDALASEFNITGNVDISALASKGYADGYEANVKAVLVESQYDSTTGMDTQVVTRIGTITNNQYSITAAIGDFFDADGKPVDKWFQIVLVMETDTEKVTVGDSFGNIPQWYPDFENGGFGFDTWRGGKLVIFTDKANDDGSWTHTETELPDKSGTVASSVTGPDLEAF